MLIDKLKGNPSLIEKFNPIYFRDRVLAKSVLKRGWALKYLDMYQDWSRAEYEILLQFCEKSYEERGFLL